MPEDPKLSEFRERNIHLTRSNAELTKQVETLTAQLSRYGDIDPSVVAAERAELTTLRASSSPARVAELEAALATEKSERQAFQKRVEAADVERLVGDEFLKAGGHPAARPVIVSLAAGVFTLEKGTLKGTQTSPNKPGEPMTISEWLSIQQTGQNHYLFKTSNGSGADPKRPSSRVTDATAPTTFGNIKVSY
jgi:hypothetical protein